MGTNRGCSASMKAVSEPFCARWPTSTENGGILWTWRIVPERGDNMTKSKPLITRSEDRAWGATVFAGTRVPANTVAPQARSSDLVMRGLLLVMLSPRSGTILQVQSMPPFSVEVGHLAQNGSLTAFIDDETPRFVPMTNVRVRWLADRRLAGRFNFALSPRSRSIPAASRRADTLPFWRRLAIDLGVANDQT